MISEKLRLVLADDDEDDCLFFRDALEELEYSAELETVHNGEQLMELLEKRSDKLPDVIFLDINMPRRNGFECLADITNNERLQHLPVIMISTSFDREVVDQLYGIGAQYYIRKPSEFFLIKTIIDQALKLVTKGNGTQPDRSGFVLTGGTSLSL